jgi:propanol-preferring alcohol dehydrogenase
MSTMTAFRMTQWGTKPTFSDIAIPQPGPGEVRVSIAAVGLCHSDILLQDSPAGAWPFEPPFTLGHENAGWIDAVGADVSNLSTGTPVLVSCVRSCGVCDQCIRGRDNYCWWSTKYTTRGVGIDGGLAAYMIAPAREVVRLNNLEPAKAAVLADAGATSYHAVRQSLPRLVPGSTAAVIGAGGLGGYAVQYLRLLGAAQVIAVDVNAERLRYAAELGAHHTVTSDSHAASAIGEITSNAGVDAIFDFVGIDTTLGLALDIAAPLSRITVCGANGGRAAVGWGAIPGGCEFVVSLGNTLADLREVVALAEQGQLRIETQKFKFAEVEQAYEALRRGELLSRALVEIT